MYAEIKNKLLSLIIILTLSLWVVSVGENRIEEKNNQDSYAGEIVELDIWYNTSLYETYLEAAAENFEKEYNVRIRLKALGSMEYIPSIQSANGAMEGPDVYITDSRYLQNLVRIGAAARTDTNDVYNEDLFWGNTWKNMEYKDNIYGYPLGFDTAVLMYNGELVSEVPDSFEDILNFSRMNQDIPAGEILKWSTQSFMCNYCFVGKYAFIAGKSGYEETVDLNNWQLFEAGEFYQALSEYFLEQKEYSYNDVKKQFADGNLRYTVVSTDALGAYKEWGADAKFAVLPAINDHLETSSISVTDLAMVNEFSDEKSAAAEFARYLSAGMADRMYELCGILPLARTGTVPQESRPFYEEYEKSQSLPKLMSTQDYWNKMQGALKDIRNGKEAAIVLGELHSDMSARIKE